MIVGERMMRNPETVSPEDTLAVAREKMEAGRFRHLPVIVGEKLVGIITDRDIRQHGRQLRITKVSAAMTEEVITVTPKTSLAEAAGIILKHKIGGLPVVVGEKLVGIITTIDLLHAFVDLTESSSKGAARS